MWASYKNTCIHPYKAFLTWVVIGENIIINFNAFHHSNHLRLLICYTGHFDEKKTVEFVSVAMCVRSYRLNTVLLICFVTWQSSKCAESHIYQLFSYFLF